MELPLTVGGPKARIEALISASRRVDLGPERKIQRGPSKSPSNLDVGPRSTVGTRRKLDEGSPKYWADQKATGALTRV